MKCVCTNRCSYATTLEKNDSVLIITFFSHSALSANVIYTSKLQYYIWDKFNLRGNRALQSKTLSMKFVFFLIHQRSDFLFNIYFNYFRGHFFLLAKEIFRQDPLPLLEIWIFKNNFNYLKLSIHSWNLFIQ